MKLVRRLAMALTVIGALMVATSGTASAHLAFSTYYCNSDSARLGIEAQAYGTGNQIVVVINGTTVLNTTFGDSIKDSFPLIPGQANSYSITITATDPAYNWFESRKDLCGVPDETVVTTAPPVVTTAAPATTAAPTVTTAAPTVTTAAPTVTTAAPATTTTIAGSGGPVPVASTTTTVAATGGTVAAAGPTPTVKSNPLLPATGSRNTIFMQLGIIAMCIGALTMILVRRPAEAS